MVLHHWKADLGVEGTWSEGGIDYLAALQFTIEFDKV